MVLCMTNKTKKFMVSICLAYFVGNSVKFDMSQIALVANERITVIFLLLFFFLHQMFKIYLIFEIVGSQLS